MAGFSEVVVGTSGPPAVRCVDSPVDDCELERDKPPQLGAGTWSIAVCTGVSTAVVGAFEEYVPVRIGPDCARSMPRNAEFAFILGRAISGLTCGWSCSMFPGPFLGEYSRLVTIVGLSAPMARMGAVTVGSASTWSTKQNSNSIIIKYVEGKRPLLL